MTLFKRINDVISANINDLLDRVGESNDLIQTNQRRYQRQHQ